MKPVIIWDVGGVILEWDPVKFSAEYAHGKCAAACLAMLQHDNWRKFDRGDLAYSELIAIYSEQLQWPEQQLNELLQAVFHSLKPQWPVIHLVQHLQNAGYEQYCLTNGSNEYLHHVTSQQFQRAYDFSLHDLFSADKIILSAAIHLAKPEREIYCYTEKTFGLQQRKIIFIDDTISNTQGAEAAGWHGIHFTTVDACLQQLRNVGVDG